MRSARLWPEHGPRTRSPSERPDRFLEYGGAVNLLIVDGHMSFEVSRGGPGPRRREHQLHAAALRPGESEAARMKRYSSLRRKLTALIAGGGIVSALIAAAGFSWLDVNRFWQNTNAQSGGDCEHRGRPGGTGHRARRPQGGGRDPQLAARRLDDPRCRALRPARRLLCQRERALCRPALPLPSDGLHRQRDAVVLVRSIQADGERQGTLVLCGQRSLHDGGAAPVPRRRRSDYRAQPGGGGGSGRGAAGPRVGAHSGDRQRGGADLPDAPVPGPRGR